MKIFVLYLTLAELKMLVPLQYLVENKIIISSEKIMYMDHYLIQN